MKPKSVSAIIQVWRKEQPSWYIEISGEVLNEVHRGLIQQPVYGSVNGLLIQQQLYYEGLWLKFYQPNKTKILDAYWLDLETQIVDGLARSL